MPSGQSYTTSFANSILSGSNQFSRRWGANNSNDSVDPYITGYSFIYFRHFPDFSALMPKNMKIQPGQAKKALHSSCTSVVVPGATLNKAEFNGLGGIKFFYPTNADWDNTVSLRFTEWSGAPIHNIIHAWVKMISDYRSGINVSPSPPTKANFTASMLYWTTKPDGVSVDFHSLITGMFPVKDPSDQFGHDFTTIDKLELDIDFSCDVIYQEDFTYEECSKQALAYKSASETFRTTTYMENDGAEGTAAGGILGNVLGGLVT